jgi:uncharacterized protein
LNISQFSSKKISEIDWVTVTKNMNEKGYSLVSRFLPFQDCEELIGSYDNYDLYRKTIVMERHRFGLGEYKYFKYPLPTLLQTIRTEIYPYLSTIANTWMKLLNIDRQFPDNFSGLQKLCQDKNQTKPTILILRYGKGGYNSMHQDLYGEVFFPFQAVLFLNEPENDYYGGEFVLMEQIPRAQSKANVLRPKKGDMLIITTNFRPVKGNKGYYRAQVKHGVSEIHNGTRHTLGIIFHDALS